MVEVCEFAQNNILHFFLLLNNYILHIVVQVIINDISILFFYRTVIK